jgi:hypothetical protein
VLPVPHVDGTDRYVVSRVEVLPGLYGVAQYLGEVALHFDEVVARIGELEQRYADAEVDVVRRTAARHRVGQFLELARHRTHVCVPLLFSGKLVLTGTSQHPAPKSKSLVMGRLTPIANYLRRVLIEYIYGRLSKPARHASFDLFL